MKNSSGKITSAMLRDQILELRVQGLTIRAIAKKVGRSHVRVAQILAKALNDLHAKNLETTQHIVDLELNRLDALLETHWKRRRWADSAGIVLRIMDRRAHLQGLDKPTKTAFTDPDGRAIDPPTLIVEFTDGSSAATSTKTPESV